MVEIYSNDKTIEPIYKNRELYEGQLIQYNGIQVNGTGATQALCYVDEVLDRDRKLYKVKEIAYPKVFDKSYTTPSCREYTLEDLDYAEMCREIGNRWAFLEYLTEITPKDVEMQYGKSWKEILEHDVNLKKRKCGENNEQVFPI